jgi:hypothetical protein
VQLTLSELREMACRQQAQIDSQHQLLAAKEQRLRYLKEQEARQQRVQAESERLRRLRDRVDAQELKLRKLRALRGQVDHQKQNNISLSESIFVSFFIDIFFFPACYCYDRSRFYSLAEKESGLCRTIHQYYWTRH